MTSGAEASARSVPHLWRNESTSGLRIRVESAFSDSPRNARTNWLSRRSHSRSYSASTATAPSEDTASVIVRSTRAAWSGVSRSDRASAWNPTSEATSR